MSAAHASCPRNFPQVDTETQYLGILKQAKTVKDTLEVSDKLDEVRGEIERQQAEFEALSKQVETVALTISLRAEAEAKVFGLNWRPLYQLKLAARQGLDSVGDYATSMASLGLVSADGPTYCGWRPFWAERPRGGEPCAGRGRRYRCEEQKRRKHCLRGAGLFGSLRRGEFLPSFPWRGSSKRGF